MSVTFDGVELLHASKLVNTIPVLANETILLSGKRSIQSNANYGFAANYTFLGTFAQVTALLAKVGSPYTLIDNQETHTTCYIYGDIRITETDSPDYFLCEMGFRQHTA